MKPLKTTPPDETKTFTLRCTHEKMWPPPLTLLNVDIRAMWRTGEISQHDYQQIETWEKVCGLKAMGDKCIDCPLAKIELPHPGAGQNRVELEPLPGWLKERKRLRMLGTKPKPKPKPAAHNPPSKKEVVVETVENKVDESPVGDSPSKKPAEKKKRTSRKRTKAKVALTDDAPAETPSTPEPEPTPTPEPVETPEPEATDSSDGLDLDKLLNE